MKILTEEEFQEKKREIEEAEVLIQAGHKTLSRDGALGYGESSAILKEGLLLSESELRTLADALKEHRLSLESKLTIEDRQRAIEDAKDLVAFEERRKAARASEGAGVQ